MKKRMDNLIYILTHSKIKDNEVCPCGSSLLFKACCKGKVIIPKTSKKPADVQVMEMMRSSLKRYCLHPDKTNCKGRIKSAHALQNNKIISLLAGKDRHVYMLNAKKKPILVPLENGEIVPVVEIDEVSANDATTETCFCDRHDNIAFAAIEKGAPYFDDSSAEMKFVYAYKAFIFEYYKQRMALDIFRECFKRTPQAFQTRPMVGQYRMLQMKMKEFEPVRKHFDKQIMGGSQEGVYTCVVKIPEQIKFADYAYIAPDYDMNGRKIKHTRKGFMHRVAITIFPEDTQSWLLVSCLEEEKHIYADLFDQFQNASLDKLKFYLNMVLPLYSENMVLSPRLWKGWSEEIQTAYTYYSNLHGPKAKAMGMCTGVGLKNAYNDKSGKAYQTIPKINLFG